MEIRWLVKDSYERACRKGFHDKPRAFGDDISLITTEVAEAYEEFRKGYDPNTTYYTDLGKKPCGVPSELADIIIRVCDTCGLYGIDLQAIIEEKLAYNETREHMH